MRRVERARRQGHVALSLAAVQAVGFVVAVALAPSALRASAHRFAGMLREALTEADAAQAAHRLADVPMIVIELTAPLLIAVGAAAALTGLVQTGGVVAMRPVAPDLSRLSPTTFVRTLFSAERGFGLIRALMSMATVAVLAAHDIQRHLPDLARLSGRLELTASAAGHIALSVAKSTAVVLLALGIADLLMTRHVWFSRLKLTKDEAQRERKEAEGDPLIRAVRRAAHRETLASGGISAVAQATVLIVDSHRHASALRFREGDDDAPVLVVKGEGQLASRMLTTALERDTPVVHDAALALGLHDAPEGEPIPSSLYEQVALVLREVYDARDRKP